MSSELESLVDSQKSSNATIDTNRQQKTISTINNKQQHKNNDEEQSRQKLQTPPSRKPSIQMNHFTRIKQIVKEAIAARHTFMICGRARLIRDCLLSRGWCEKFHKRTTPNTYTNAAGDLLQLSVDSNPTALLAGIGNLNERQNERLLMSKMLSSHTVDFLWNAGSEWTGWPSQENKTTIFNRFTRANFTSKIGLCTSVRQMHWYYESGIANTLFPRCYNVSQTDQLHAFIDDFRLTACLSLLKWYVDKVKNEGEESIKAANGIVPLKAMDFAIGRCSDYLGSKSHEDLDQDLEKVWSHQWEQFITWYYKLVHGKALFIANNVPVQKYLVTAQNLLTKLKQYCPQLEMDGTLNVWILKPGNKSRGRGIVLMNNLDDILTKVNPTNKATDTRFVIQKYIERPLLIYETKFDIRQWFIVTNAQPLTLWMYKESYLRFCSQKFSLTDFHESIHLSNNAVQCKYKNCPDRDPSLPVENMWDIAAFKSFLKSRGNENAWEELIYPGMREGLVGSLLASQEAMDQRKNSFELYGADFMVMEDFSVWLIEINSHPDMSNSTSVTTRLCRKALEDTIKVVIDHRENNNAETGDFELAYKQKSSSGQIYLGSALTLQGSKISFPINEKRANNSVTISETLSKNKKSLLQQQQQQGNISVGPVLVDLIEELELKLDNEFYEYLKLKVTSGVSRQLPALQRDNDNNNNKVNNLKNFEGENVLHPITAELCDAGTCTAPTKSVSLMEDNKINDDDNDPNVDYIRRSSQTILKSIGNGKLTKNAKTFSNKKSTKYKTKTPRQSESNADSTLTTNQILVDKIEEAKKGKTDTKGKSLAINSMPKSHHRLIKSVTKSVSVSNNQKPKETKTNSTTKNYSYDKRIIPFLTNDLSSFYKKEETIKKNTIDDKKNLKNNQILYQVSNIYAVGLAMKE